MLIPRQLNCLQWVKIQNFASADRFGASPFCLVIQTEPNMDVCRVNRAVHHAQEYYPSIRCCRVISLHAQNEGRVSIFFKI